MPVNYQGRFFRSVSNSANGQVGNETIFKYSQQGEEIRAEYSGGVIRFGQILGQRLADDSLVFLYQHLTHDGCLCSGRCQARPEVLADGRLRMKESWQWTFPEHSAGESMIEEICTEDGNIQE